MSANCPRFHRIVRLDDAIEVEADAVFNSSAVVVLPIPRMNT